MMKNIAFVSTVISAVISITLAGLFLIGSLGSKYTSVERIGGVGWVLLLSMIILMPVITPLVKRKFGERSSTE